MNDDWSYIHICTCMLNIQLAIATDIAHWLFQIFVHLSSRETLPQTSTWLAHLDISNTPH